MAHPICIYINIFITIVQDLINSYKSSTEDPPWQIRQPLSCDPESPKHPWQASLKRRHRCRRCKAVAIQTAKSSCAEIKIKTPLSLSICFSIHSSIPESLLPAPCFPCFLLSLLPAFPAPCSLFSLLSLLSCFPCFLTCSFVSPKFPCFPEFLTPCFPCFSCSPYFSCSSVSPNFPAPCFPCFLTCVLASFLFWKKEAIKCRMGKPCSTVKQKKCRICLYRSAALSMGLHFWAVLTGLNHPVGQGRSLSTLPIKKRRTDSTVPKKKCRMKTEKCLLHLQPWSVE